MAIIMSTEIKKQMMKEITRSKNSLQIITAFCKKDGIQFIEDNIIAHNIDKRLLVRFRMNDLLSGASDLSIYNYCKHHGWTVYIRFDLHAKTYIFDNKRCIIGSANLTNNGIVNENGGNYEIATICEIDSLDVTKVNSLFINALKLNDELYNLMLEEYKNIDFKTDKHFEWSNKIISQFTPDYAVLFPDDFPLYSNYKDYVGYSIEFLGLNKNWTETELREAFRFSKSYLWLKTLLLNNEKEMYFGEITANLHNVLVNDPRPYRKEIKELLSKLLQWIQDLHINEIQIDRPNYSQRIKINQKQD